MKKMRKLVPKDSGAMMTTLGGEGRGQAGNQSMAAVGSQKELKDLVTMSWLGSLVNVFGWLWYKYQVRVKV